MGHGPVAFVCPHSSHSLWLYALVKLLPDSHTDRAATRLQRCPPSGASLTRVQHFAASGNSPTSVPSGNSQTYELARTIAGTWSANVMVFAGRCQGWIAVATDALAVFFSFRILLLPLYQILLRCLE